MTKLPFPSHQNVFINYDDDDGDDGDDDGDDDDGDDDDDGPLVLKSRLVGSMLVHIVSQFC